MALILATKEHQVCIGYRDTSQTQEQREWLKVSASLVLLDNRLEVYNEDRCLWVVPQQAGRG
jgi:hypothetical protein